MPIHANPCQTSADQCQTPKRNMAASTETCEALNISLYEEVPKHDLRSANEEYSSDSDEDEKPVVDDYDERDGDIPIESDTVLDSLDSNKVNTGWADAMAKVLKTNKPKRKKSVVLAKAKKLTQVVKKECVSELGFEIDGEIKEEKPDPASIKVEPEGKKDIKKVKKSEWSSRGRIKPSVLDKNREKVLAKIATKGVVQLFNTVSDHQKLLNSKLNKAGCERKREKILKSVDKRAFLDMLMGPTAGSGKRNADLKTEPEIKEEDTSSTWQVLRNDFMMGASLKDWDKQEDANNRQDSNNCVESDSTAESGSDDT